MRCYFPWIGSISPCATSPDGSSGSASASAGFETCGTAWHVTARLRMGINDPKTNPKEASKWNSDDFENRKRLKTLGPHIESSKLTVNIVKFRNLPWGFWVKQIDPKETIYNVFRLGPNCLPHFGAPFARCFLLELPDVWRHQLMLLHVVTTDKCRQFETLRRKLRTTHHQRNWLQFQSIFFD